MATKESTTWPPGGKGKVVGGNVGLGYLVINSQILESLTDMSRGIDDLVSVRCCGVSMFYSGAVEWLVDTKFDS